MRIFFVVTDCGIPVAIFPTTEEASAFIEKRGKSWWRVMPVPYKCCEPL